MSENRFYSIEDKTELISIYLSVNSFRRTAEIFKERHPGRERYPGHVTIQELFQKFQNFGTLERKKVINKKKTVITEDKVIDILAEITNNTIQTGSTLGNKAGVSKSSANKCLKSLGFKPYKLRRVQPLYGN